MKDSYYFRHDSNAHADMKIKAMIKLYGWQGYGWWWFLIEKLRAEDGYSLEYDDWIFASLAEDMKCEVEETKTYIDKCISFKLLARQDKRFYAPRLSRDMQKLDEIREKRSEAGKKSHAPKDDDVSESIVDSIIDPDLKQIVGYYEEQIGHVILANEYELMKTYLTTYGLGKLTDAVDITAKARPRVPFRYMEKIVIGDNNNNAENRRPATQTAGRRDDTSKPLR